MASLRPRCYFLAPFTTIPPSGPIQLGSIVSSPSLAHEPVNDAPIPPSSFGEKVYDCNDERSKIVLDVSRTRVANAIFGEFYTFLRGKTGSSASQSDQETWEFENLQTRWFTPSDKYVMDSVRNNMDVQNYIAENPFWGTKIYMVTGVMISHGASSTITLAQQKGIHLSLDIHSPTPAAPAVVSPGLESQRVTSVGISQVKPDPFVFAFRLRKINVSVVGNVTHEGYNDGALFSIGGGQDDEGRGRIVRVEGLEDDDLDPIDMGLESGLVVGDLEGKENVSCRFSRALYSSV
ncbi:hypothetical protein PT974_09817 [Cladobotryum mycophilum]|uniref:Uncharacterized protein n=1 Tax=Cladobotryum mycophilum TaxID=491253 RepID=A0ABR0SHA8_9HYPO